MGHPPPKGPKSKARWRPRLPQLSGYLLGQLLGPVALLTLLPTLLVIILPIAFFFGTLFTLSRLNGDSELVVMASAGYSQRQLAVPVFMAAAIVMAITWTCALWLMPLGERALSAK